MKEAGRWIGFRNLSGTCVEITLFQSTNMTAMQGQGLGLELIGILGVLLRAKRAGDLGSVKNAMESLRSDAGFFVDAALYQTVKSRLTCRSSRREPRTSLGAGRSRNCRNWTSAISRRVTNPHSFRFTRTNPAACTPSTISVFPTANSPGDICEFERTGAGFCGCAGSDEMDAVNSAGWAQLRNHDQLEEAFLGVYGGFIATREHEILRRPRSHRSGPNRDG